MVDIAQQLQLPPPPPPPPPANKPPVKPIKKSSFHDNVESIDMDLSDDESAQKLCGETEENLVVNNHRPDVFINEQKMLEPPPPIPQNLRGEMSGDSLFENETGKNENGTMDMERAMNNPLPPPMPEILGPSPPFLPPPHMSDLQHMSEVPTNLGWYEDWVDRPQDMNIPPPHIRPPFSGPGLQQGPHGPPLFKRGHPNEFRGSFRGRGEDRANEMFRGRGRGRGFRGGRGMNNVRGPNRGFRGNRAFRGHFRGGF